MLGLDAEMRRIDRQDARHLAAHAVGRIGGAEQRQHRVLHPAGEARGRASGGQQPIGALALDAQHRRHVIGHAVALHPRRRLQYPVQVGMLGQPGRIGTQERLDEAPPAPALARVAPPAAGSSSAVQAICWPVLAQSARNAARPLSVSGWLNNCRSTAGGTVATCAPILAASTTCIGLRTEATSTSVLNAA